jgi:hypothetical protein
MAIQCSSDDTLEAIREQMLSRLALFREELSRADRPWFALFGVSEEEVAALEKAQLEFDRKAMAGQGETLTYFDLLEHLLRQRCHPLLSLWRVATLNQQASDYAEWILSQTEIRYSPFQRGIYFGPEEDAGS